MSVPERISRFFMGLPLQKFLTLFLPLILIGIQSGCIGSTFQKRATSSGSPAPKIKSLEPLSIVGKELSPQQAEAVLDEVGTSFIYGPMLGETAANIGAVVLFPPYGLYLIGNAILSLSGYETVAVSSLLSKQAGESWNGALDTVFSLPGRVVAAVAGREARSREVTELRLNEILLGVE